MSTKTKNIALCGILLIASLAGARTEVPKTAKNLKFVEKQTYYVIADSANIYVQPHMHEEILKSLRTGDSARLNETNELYTENGVTAPWCELIWGTGNALRKGHLWAGDLAPASVKNKDVLFLLSAPAVSSSGENNFIVKAVKLGKVIATSHIKLPPAPQTGYSVTADIKSGTGAAGFTQLVVFSFFDANQSPDKVEQYFGWDGKNFTALPLLTSKIGAGHVQFSTEKLLTGKGNSKKDAISIEHDDYSVNTITAKNTLVKKEVHFYKLQKDHTFTEISKK